jgi:hypothetical protein
VPYVILVLSVHFYPLYSIIDNFNSLRFQQIADMQFMNNQPKIEV